MASTQQQTHPFTCNSCQVAFKSSDMQRTHMQSDWHRYNLKRRVASLPPLSSEIFAEKVLASKADAAADAARASFEKNCAVCKKTYFSENAYDNHLGSAKHKSNLLRAARAHRQGKHDDETRSVMSSTFSLGDPSTKAGEDSEESDEEVGAVAEGLKRANLDKDGAPVGEREVRGETTKEDALNQCLFCNRISLGGLKTNVAHMVKAHDLFIPERSFLSDPEGLFLYLFEKVHLDFQCLKCNKLKHSEDGIKQHMVDLGHCKIAYETEDDQLEIGQYYDFRSTYSDDEDEDSDDEDVSDDNAAPGGGVKLGARREAVDDDSDGEAGEDDKGWETSSTVSSVPTSELGIVLEDESKEKARQRKLRLRQHKHHAHSSSSKHKSADGFHSKSRNGPTAVYRDEFELFLPSGRVAGHRDLNKYYRQNLHSYPTEEERAQRLLTSGDEATADDESGSDEDGARGRARNRALIARDQGGRGMLHVSEAKKGQVKKMEKRERQNERKMLAKVQWRADKKGNNQKHFRDPLLQ